MRIALITILAIHGLIHLLGFLKAFGIAELSAINQAVSKTAGLFWLLTFVLFAVTIALLLFDSDYWWIGGLLAVIVSQLLIFSSWSDTKFGSIANAIILLASVAAYSNFSLNSMLKQERIDLFNKSKSLHTKIVGIEDIASLPMPVQKWLINSAVIGKPAVSNVHLTQELQLKLKPDQSEWNEGTAEQYFTIQPPAFNWNIDTKMNSFLHAVGRDKFEDGQGEMLIKLFALIPVVDVNKHDKINQASLQRFLSEIAWFPSAATSPYIHWESIDDHSARATMTFNKTSGSGVFHFDEHGQFEKFTAMRYRDVNDSEPVAWTITAIKTEQHNGVNIPTECEVTWSLDTGEWTWLKVGITDIKYNLATMPAGN